MERIKKSLRGQPKPDQREYEAVPEEPTALDGSVVLEGSDEVPFSWVEYSIFTLLGVAMLWAWYPPSPLGVSQN